MKLYKPLILAGVLFLALALGIAACGPAATPAPTAVPPTAVPPTAVPPTAIPPTEVPPTLAPTDVPAAPVLEIVGLTETKALTMADLQALPASEGYAGIKSSTGKITLPAKFKGVALKDLAKLAGMDASSGLNIVAEDGYSITFSYDQVENGTFIAYDPANGDELKSPPKLTGIIAYEMDGQPLDKQRDGTLRLTVISEEMNQVTDGHWAVKWVNKLEIKPLVQEWSLAASGGIEDAYDRATIESCSAPQCHGASWKDDKAQEWTGVPLWILVGGVDDEIKHEGAAFNQALADAGYTVDVIASDGYTVTFDSKRIARNGNILLASKVNDNPLTEKYFPMRLVGSDLQKNEMSGMVTKIVIHLPAKPAAVSNVPADQATFTLTGLVNQELTLNEAALRTLEVKKITAEHPKKGKEDYEGVSLNTLLDLAGLKDGAKTLLITAADGFSAEIDLAAVRACADCLLGFTNTAEKFKMVLPGLESNFWVKDVVKIEVK